MKTILTACAAVVALVGPAAAWEREVIACYTKVYMPPEISTSKELVMAAHYEWVHENGQMKRVYYPAVYVENRSQTKPGYYVARQAPCVVGE